MRVVRRVWNAEGWGCKIGVKVVFVFSTALPWVSDSRMYVYGTWNDRCTSGIHCPSCSPLLPGRSPLSDRDASYHSVSLRLSECSADRAPNNWSNSTVFTRAHTSALSCTRHSSFTLVHFCSNAAHVEWTGSRTKFIQCGRPLSDLLAIQERTESRDDRTKIEMRVSKAGRVLTFLGNEYRCKSSPR